MKSFPLILFVQLAFCLTHLQAQNAEDALGVAYGGSLSGASFQTEAGYLFNAEKEENTRGLSIRQSADWKMNAFSVGAGIGYDQYETQNIMPAFLQLRMELIQDEKYSPFLSAQGGYGVSITADESNEVLGESFSYDGGVYYQLGGGLMIRSRENISWIISLAYINQSHSRVRSYVEPVDNGSLSVEENYVDNRIAFRLGFIF